MREISQDSFLVCGDLLVDSERVIRDSCVEIEGDRIRGVKRRESGDLDFRGSGSIVLPGFIDMHVHLRGLALSYKEDEYTGTLSALHGCLTGVADMPNTVPPLSSVEALSMKLRALEENSLVDYAVYAGVPSRGETARSLAEMPVVGFKIYPEDMEKKEALCWVLREAESRGLLVVVHAEHPLLIKTPDYGYDRRNLRRCESEMLAVLEIAEVAERCRARPRIHITHVSCESTLKLAKSLGFTTDVTPHHLLFAQEEAPSLFSPYCESKVNPPLRDIVERTRLWIGLLEGLVDAIASDHAPHAPYEKTFQSPPLCSPGFSSLEVWPGAIARIFLKAGLPQALAELASAGPSRLLGLGECRELAGGCSASLTVFSTSSSKRGPLLYTKAPISPYSSLDRLECLSVVIRGRVALFEGKVVVGRGFGRNLALSRAGR